MFNLSKFIGQYVTKRGTSIILWARNNTMNC